MLIEDQIFLKYQITNEQVKGYIRLYQNILKKYDSEVKTSDTKKNQLNIDDFKNMSISKKVNNSKSERELTSKRNELRNYERKKQNLDEEKAFLISSIIDLQSQLNSIHSISFVLNMNWAITFLLICIWALILKGIFE